MEAAADRVDSAAANRVSLIRKGRDESVVDRDEHAMGLQQSHRAGRALERVEKNDAHPFAEAELLRAARLRPASIIVLVFMAVTPATRMLQGTAPGAP
jgi:hypothetical protein